MTVSASCPRAQAGPRQRQRRFPDGRNLDLRDLTRDLEAFRWCAGDRAGDSPWDDGVGPVPANMQSLSMLICTEGKERSAVEYTRLLQSAGFTEIDARRTGVPLDAILAVK